MGLALEAVRLGVESLEVDVEAPESPVIARENSARPAHLKVAPLWFCGF